MPRKPKDPVFAPKLVKALRKENAGTVPVIDGEEVNTWETDPLELPWVPSPADPDEMLLSGVLVGGQALANRAQVIDIPVGEGHVVSFAIRPFWRWQTQGTYFLGFNTILNWNDLDAGRPAPRGTQ